MLITMKLPALRSEPASAHRREADLLVAVPNHGPLGATPRHRPDRRPLDREQLFHFADVFGLDVSGCLD